MSALADDLQLDFWTTHELERASRPALAAVDPEPAAGDERTLEDVILGAWEGLVAHRTVACPVCGEAMSPINADPRAPLEADCRGCGTRLS